MKSKTVNMLSGSITKGLLSMTIPIMIMNVMQSLFNVTDMTVLRFFSDDKAVGAVGACGSLIVLCTSLLIGISAGANVVVARRVGSGDKVQSDRAVMTALLFSIIGGLVLTFIGATFAETFLKMTNCPIGLLPQATKYFKIYFYGVPIMMLYNFCASILRAIGDTKRPMYFLIIGGIVKALLTVLFVSVLNVDVEGVALATVLSQVVSAALLIRALAKADAAYKFEFKKLSIKKKSPAVLLVRTADGFDLSVG